jgi:hypothetical protein
MRLCCVEMRLCCMEMRLCCLEMRLCCMEVRDCCVEIDDFRTNDTNKPETRNFSMECCLLEADLLHASTNVSLRNTRRDVVAS